MGCTGHERENTDVVIKKREGGKMKTWFLIGIVAIVSLTSACSSSSFLVYKDGKGCFVGSGSDNKFTMLCASGDLEKVLAVTHLSNDLKDSFYKYNCSAERSSD